MPSAFWAFVLYAPAAMFVNAPFGIAYGALTVITPPPIRARVAAIYMLITSFGMFLGPPIAGLFNESIFPGDNGVSYSLAVVSSLFGLIGFVLLMFARRPYARSLEAAEVWAEESLISKT